MTEARSRVSMRALSLCVTAGLFAAVSVLFAGAASAQSVDCPAGARGGAGGDAGRTVGGNGGLAFTVPGFASSTGSADASGSQGGSARGGTGGRGGSGTLPVCNQNTNGATASPVAVARPGVVGTGGGSAPAGGGGGGGGGGGARYGSGGGLARTGARTSTELGLAGLAFVAGGMLLFLGQPLRRIRARA